MSHTPTPWTHQGLEDEGEERGAVFLIGEDLGGMVGAALPLATELNDGDFERVVANAAFIVKAVNAYEDLVAACQLAYADYEATEHGSPAFIALEQALEKAGVL